MSASPLNSRWCVLYHIRGTDYRIEPLQGTDYRNESLQGTDFCNESLLGTDHGIKSLQGIDYCDESLQGTDYPIESLQGTDNCNESLIEHLYIMLYFQGFHCQAFPLRQSMLEPLAPLQCLCTAVVLMSNLTYTAGLAGIASARACKRLCQQQSSCSPLLQGCPLSRDDYQGICSSWPGVNASLLRHVWL